MGMRVEAGTGVGVGAGVTVIADVGAGAGVCAFARSGLADTADCGVGVAAGAGSLPHETARTTAAVTIIEAVRFMYFFIKCPLGERL